MSEVQNLLLDDTLFNDVLSGKQRATIRIGVRPITLGPLVFKATRAGYLPLKVWVSSVSTKMAAHVTDDEARLAGAKDAEDLIRILTGFYPDNMKPTTPVTIIEFTRQ